VGCLVCNNPQRTLWENQIMMLDIHQAKTLNVGHPRIKFIQPLYSYPSMQASFSGDPPFNYPAPFIITGKSDLTRWGTNREAVFGFMIHTIFEPGSMNWYGPAHWLDYFDSGAIMCPWYCTSCCTQQTWNQTAKCISLHTSKYTLKYTPDCTRLFTPSLLDLHSEPAWLTLSSKLSRCFQSHSGAGSQVHSQLPSMESYQLA